MAIRIATEPNEPVENDDVLDEEDGYAEGRNQAHEFFEGLTKVMNAFVSAELSKRDDPYFTLDVAQEMCPIIVSHGYVPPRSRRDPQ